MENHQQPLLPVPIEPIVALVQEKVPKMQKARDGAVAAMRDFYTKFNELFQKYQADPEGMKDTMDSMVAEANDLLVKIKKTYDGVYAMRKGITDTTDQIKEFLMQFEKDLSYDAKANTGYNHIRSIIQKFKQAELDLKKKAEAEAARKREVENYKVDLVTAMKKNLLDLLADKIERANTQSRAYFDASTLEDFDERAKVFTGMKVKLKQDDYEKCFEVFYDNTKINNAEYLGLVNKTRLEETYDKWNEKIVVSVTPILNEWRAKIPDIKRQMVEMAKADEDQKKLLAEEQAKQAAAEDARRKADAERLQQAEKNAIEQQAEVNRMSNSFVEQAVVQELADSGPSKKVLRFSDKKEEQGQAFLSLIYHVMMHPKFVGLFKKDKDGALVLDKDGNKQYSTMVEPWVKFFETHCKERTVEGAVWEEQAKVIVRK
jgi:hypothetical protein